MTILSEIARGLGEAERIAVVSHVDPDPDAIGSTLGLTLALRSLGKTVVALNDDGAPAETAFLPGADTLVKQVPDGFAPEVLVCLDSSDTVRLGEVAAPFLSAGIPVYNVDHHVTNLKYGSLNLVDSHAASAAEMLPALIDAVGAPLDQDAASCLLAGMIGDTRSFSTSSVTGDTLRTAARLVDAGADAMSITEAVFSSSDYKTLRMWGIALSNARLEKGVIWTTITAGERRDKGLNGVGATGMSNLLLTASEANISAVLTEQDDGSVRLSMRARPEFNVAEVALDLGGGGHPAAAGATLDGPVPSAARKVIPRLKKISRRNRKA